MDNQLQVQEEKSLCWLSNQADVASPDPAEGPPWWWCLEVPQLSFFVPESSSLLSLRECLTSRSGGSSPALVLTHGQLKCSSSELVASGDPCTRVQKAAASVGAGGNPVRITRGSSHRRALSRTPSSQHGRSRGGRFSQQLARGRAGCLFTLFNPSSEARSGAAANLIRSLCVEAPFRDGASPPWWSSFLTNCLRSGEGQASDSTHRLSKPLFSECGLPGCRTVIWHLQAGGDSLC